MEILRKENLLEYKRFVLSNQKGHFMQGPEWAQVKNNWNSEVVVERDKSGEIIGGILVLIRRLPGLPFSIMYSPRGPVCDIHDTKTLESLMKGVRNLAKKYRAYVFKMDPDVAASADDFARQLLSMGFERKGGGKNFEEIQPRFVFRLDTGNQTEDEVFAKFHSKTRYNIRVALKRGVEVKIMDRSALKEFMPIMRETGLRDGFPIRPLEYFDRMMQVMGEHARLYMAYYEGKPVAGTIAVQYGDKTWYLYGASSNEYRNIMPNYLLQWEMIRWSVESGCRVYDFRGVSGDLSESNPLYGLYRFKKGFNGEFTEFVGEFDLILNQPVALLVENGLKFVKKLRLLTNRRHKVKK
ncbi:MAG TPA: peptidoglycan bridge formation glycyltransferase FemA/FemB family protein [Clostridia bacterium]|nr:peptidoglycan bridge formation glycyltransferase FemA/FemB family protein [Clostridia bacterium]